LRYTHRSATTHHLPPDDLLGLAFSWWEVGVDELYVVRLQVFDFRDVIALAVQVIWVERPDRRQHLLILRIHHPLVPASTVPRVERVVSDHCEGLIRESALLLADMVEIFIVAPAQHDIVQAAAGWINPVFGAVDLVPTVGIVGERARVDDALIEPAADRESVAHYIPLAPGVVEEEELAQIVDQTRQLEPFGLAISADCLGGLQEMLDLAERRVRIGFIDQRIELLHRLPNCHARPRLGVEVIAGFEVVCDRLLRVLLTVEILDSVAGFFVLPKLGLVLVGVELRLLIDVNFFLSRSAVLDSQGRFQDVHLVDRVRCGFESQSIPMVVELLGDVGRFDQCCGCHGDMLEEPCTWRVWEKFDKYKMPMGFQEVRKKRVASSGARNAEEISLFQYLPCQKHPYKRQILHLPTMTQKETTSS